MNWRQSRVKTPRRLREPNFYAAAVSGLACQSSLRRLRIAYPVIPKPTIIRAHVPGSGTADVKATVPAKEPLPPDMPLTVRV